MKVVKGEKKKKEVAKGFGKESRRNIYMRASVCEEPISVFLG
jgi:hypothetical protein